MPRAARLTLPERFIKKNSGTPMSCLLYTSLKAIGVEFTEEYLQAVKRSEEERIRQKHLKKQQLADNYDFSDDRFAFIAGYTDGGAAYGITWEELGLEPYASYEELMEAYDQLDRQREQEIGFDDLEEDIDSINGIW